jgi:hypothetical protein
VDEATRREVFGELVNRWDQMFSFMPDRRFGNKETPFLRFFSLMAGAVEIVRMLPERGAREKVLASAREFLLRRF